jgi:thiol-disulfide isomerase/thioredoxin
MLGRAILIGEPLPRLDLTAVADGQAVNLPRALRSRVVVIDFFATWCEPCRDSLPVFERLQKRFADRVDFVSISEDERREAVARFVREHRLGGRVLLDPGRAAFDRLGAHLLPTTYVLDEHAVVRKINHGYGSGFEARMVRWLEQLTRSPPHPTLPY